MTYSTDPLGPYVVTEEGVSVTREVRIPGCGTVTRTYRVMCVNDGNPAEVVVTDAHGVHPMCRACAGDDGHCCCGGPGC